MKNYKIIIQYNGTGYSGWQIQKNGKSIQQVLTDALELLTKEKINLIGAGRTDTGVHAFGQVGNFRTENTLDLYRFKHSLNSILPYDIAISSIEEVDYDFHARYDAKKRTYIYLITTAKSAFYRNFSYFYHKKIDIKSLNQLSRSFIGENDFTSFSRQTEVENKICTLYEAKWSVKGDLIIFYISANRYLHGMVRAITGTLLRSQELNLTESYIEEIFNSRSREKAFESVPACGLFLYKVEY